MVHVHGAFIYLLFHMLNLGRLYVQFMSKSIYFNNENKIASRKRTRKKAIQEKTRFREPSRRFTKPDWAVGNVSKWAGPGNVARLFPCAKRPHFAAMSGQ